MFLISSLQAVQLIWWSWCPCMIFAILVYVNIFATCFAQNRHPNTCIKMCVFLFHCCETNCHQGTNKVIFRYVCHSSIHHFFTHICARQLLPHSWYISLPNQCLPERCHGVPGPNGTDNTSIERSAGQVQIPVINRLQSEVSTRLRWVLLYMWSSHQISESIPSPAEIVIDHLGSFYLWPHYSVYFPKFMDIGEGWNRRTSLSIVFSWGSTHGSLWRSDHQSACWSPSHSHK